MKSVRRRFESKAGSFLFRALRRWILRKTPQQAYRIGTKVGRLAYFLSRKHRRRTISNLVIAFPEMSASERKRLAVRVFQHFGQIAADFMRCASRTQEQVLADTTIEGYEHFAEALAQGRGLLLITGHFGNWERGAHWITCKGHAMSVVARDANDSDLNNLVIELRESTGIEVIPRGNAVRPILQALRRNAVVAILPDQNSDESFIPFFGKPAGTVLGPAVLHARSGAPMIPAACISTGPGKMHIIVGPPLKPAEGWQNPAEAMMCAVNKALEDAIRGHPEQYLWLHDRWKAARRRGLL